MFQGGQWTVSCWSEHGGYPRQAVALEKADTWVRQFNHPALICWIGTDQDRTYRIPWGIVVHAGTVIFINKTQIRQAT